MGIWMTEEIRKLGKFFLYTHDPLVIAIGGSHTNFNIRDRLLLLNQIIEMNPKYVIIGGKLALYFLKALEIHVGIDNDELSNEYSEICLDFLRKMTEKGI